MCSKPSWKVWIAFFFVHFRYCILTIVQLLKCCTVWLFYRYVTERQTKLWLWRWTSSAATELTCCERSSWWTGSHIQTYSGGWQEWIVALTMGGYKKTSWSLTQKICEFNYFFLNWASSKLVIHSDFLLTHVSQVIEQEDARNNLDWAHFHEVTIGLFKVLRL